MPTTEDRLTMLRTRADDYTGIDFVQIVDGCEQTTLRIFFLTDPQLLAKPFEDLGDPSVVEELLPEDIQIYSPRGEAPDVPVVFCSTSPNVLEWVDDAETGRRVLEICVPEPGTHTDYRLKVDDDRIDRVFNDVTFSFKVGCPSGLDCAQPAIECVPEPLVDYPVDYLARDFVSLRNALLDFAALRYPLWQQPREADMGVMLAEILAAVGDEMAYVQDRYNRDAYLEIATERRSLRRKARLVDHEIHDGLSATTLIELAVLGGVTSVDGGWPIWVRNAGADPIAFELGEGMQDRGKKFPVDALWNPGEFTLYCFDDDLACLPVGATELFVRNDPANPDNPGGVKFDAAAAALWGTGRLLLIRRVPPDPSESERLFVVRVVEVVLESDPLFGIDIARIRWDPADALPAPLSLEELQLSGNLVPATAGRTRTAFFRLGDLQGTDEVDGVLQTVEREGPLYSEADPSLLRRHDPCEDADAPLAERPPIHLASLPGTDVRGLGWLTSDGDLRNSEPETEVYLVASIHDPPIRPWTFRRSLLVDGSDDRSYTIEDGTWRRIIGYFRGGEEVVHRDYATGAGYTVRFGDGEFGILPPPGSLFRIDYRFGPGASANAPVGSVSALEIPGEVSPLLPLVEAARNPFSVTEGVDPESHAEIKSLAPFAYRAETFFAVRPEDYGEQAQKLDFVQRAQGAFRWTGSWLSAITAVDPTDSYTLSAPRRDRVEALLDCRRQAGREVIVANPKFVNLDLVIRICVARTSFRVHVKRTVLETLFGNGGPNPQPGFFHPDNFTFGSPLRRSALEAAIQSTSGVEAVLGIDVRRVGVTSFEPLVAMTLEVASDEVIRLENDPARPERGSLVLELEGGA